MKKTIVNPWKWQDRLGYAQAVEISHASHTLYCAGQAAMNADGSPVAADMEGQIKVSFDNLETVLHSSGYSMANVVRVNYFTTSIEQFFGAYPHVLSRFPEGFGAPAVTLTEVNALAFPGLMVEIEATAVR